MYTVSEITNIWQKTQSILEKKFDKKTYDSFFSDTYILDITNNKVIFAVNSQLAKSLIETNYKKELINALNEITGETFTISATLQNNKSHVSQPEQNKNKNKEVIFFKDSKIDHKLKFENYIVGDFNKTATRAAKVVAEQPGKRFNPLFIYSNSGLGKTHLLHSVGNYVLEHTPDKANILYLPAQVFVDEYIKYVTGDKSLDNIQDYFNDVDVLLFDDAQLLKERVKSQEMFFIIYEKLIAKGKQIVITSDKHPNELKGLENRLVTRFQQGLVATISEPDIDSCVEILKSHIKAEDYNPARFDNDVLTFCASQYCNNFRELSGAINGLIFAMEDLPENERVTMDFAIKTLGGFPSSNKLSSQLSEQKIINEVASFYKLSPSQLTGESREAPIAKARHIAIYLIYTTIKDIPLKKIGAMFSGKDHSTIKYSVEKVEKEIKTNPTLKSAINKIKDNLNSK